MKKPTEGSGGYTAHPIRLLIYGAPTVQIRDEVIRTALGQTEKTQRYEMTGVSTLVTNVDKAHAWTQAKLRACQRAVRKKDFQPLVELVREEPWFLEHPWVKEFVNRFEGHPRYKGKKGRQHCLKIDPDVVRGFVDSVIASGRARSIGRACSLLAGWASVSEEHARRLYRKANSDTRCRAYVIVFPSAMRVSEDEAHEVRARYPLLESGQSADFTTEVPGHGQVQMRFQGFGEGAPTKDFVVLLPGSLKVLRG